MKHHRNAVPAVLIIQFDQIGTGGERQLEGRQGVFRSDFRKAAMADDQRTIGAE